MTPKLGSKKLLNANFGYRIEQRSYTRTDPFVPDKPSHRWVFLVLLVIVFVVVGIGKLTELQIIAGSYYRSLAEGNRIRRVPVKAPRGEILDRSGKPLARNIPVYKLATFTSGGVVEKTDTISREEAIAIQTQNREEASRLLIDVGREYPMGEVTAHVVGYVNESTKEEVKDKFQLGDLVGRMGVEQQYDSMLRGINGEELIEVDARGRLVRRLGRREAQPGKTIKLTLDSNLQQEAFNALKSAPDEKGLPRSAVSPPVKGAAVVTSAIGEVFALVSIPSFNPNEIGQKYEEYAKDTNLPFFNRAIGGAYHPGSTFKIVTSVASLEEGVLDENFKYTDVGFVEAGGLKFRNWYFVRYGKGEGEMNIVRAITRSTDTFFYIAGEKVGIDSLARWAGKLGIGKKSGIDLPNEATGLMPTPEWKLEAKGERWFLGNTYNTAIGQGDVTGTPLQINTITSVIANGGQVCTPHLINAESQNFKFEIDSNTSWVNLKLPCRDLNLQAQTLGLIRRGLVGACSPDGTSLRFVDFKHKVACKTGTAETVGEKTHAWFTAFGDPSEASAEGDSSQIVVTALVEEAGEGSVVAAPVVKKIFEKHFGE